MTLTKFEKKISSFNFSALVFFELQFRCTTCNVIKYSSHLRITYLTDKKIICTFFFSLHALSLHVILTRKHYIEWMTSVYYIDGKAHTDTEHTHACTHTPNGIRLSLSPFSLALRFFVHLILSGCGGGDGDGDDGGSSGNYGITSRFNGRHIRKLSVGTQNRLYRIWIACGVYTTQLVVCWRKKWILCVGIQFFFFSFLHSQR